MKKLTDKIYIAESNSHPGFFAQEYFLPYKWGRFKSIEYIRKDALLDLVKKEMKEWSSESNTAQGVKMGLSLVLDKIESL